MTNSLAKSSVSSTLSSLVNFLEWNRNNFDLIRIYYEKENQSNYYKFVGFLNVFLQEENVNG